MTTTTNESVFEHRYEAVENLVHEAARWACAHHERQTTHDLDGNLQANEQNAAQDLATAIREVALHGIEAHVDDLHVDATAAAMKRRLAEKRAAGYRGWNDPNDCHIENLAILLHRSLRQGKALDVANFAMMLYRREAAPEAITAALSPWLTPPKPAAELVPHADLQGLRDTLLAPRKILRDEEGWLTHPAMPAVDEDVPYDRLLAAFGIETFVRDMETDADEATAKRYFDDGHPDCSAWTPTPPEGEGWRLLEIFDSEIGPYALFARAAQTEPSRRRQDVAVPSTDSANPVEAIDAEMRRAIASPDGRAVDVLIEALNCTLREHGFMVASGDTQGHAAEVAIAFNAAHLALGWSLSHPMDFDAAAQQQAEPAADEPSTWNLINQYIDAVSRYTEAVRINVGIDSAVEECFLLEGRLWARIDAQFGQRAGVLDGWDVIRRTSVIELVDRARADQLDQRQTEPAEGTHPRAWPRLSCPPQHQSGATPPPCPSRK
ncbi:hypothetical protein [Ralstonia pseudosolanacearum]|uniref:hypothetical protein n=1 Tax=Ralstonia pseudosolanacearum TaxID=1310165 RepID=UPI00223411AC|nr:hypothetical protein [Ralstonia sp. RS642]UZF26643.1 hypothetical protein LGV80_09090 [Ralstonia sp. RS642]